MREASPSVPAAELRVAAASERKRMIMERTTARAYPICPGRPSRDLLPESGKGGMSSIPSMATPRGCHRLRGWQRLCWRAGAMGDHSRPAGSIEVFLGAVLLGILTGAANPGGAMAAWDGTQQLVPGDGASAALVAPPGNESHFYRFYAPGRTTLNVKWKVDQGLVLDVAVLDPTLAPLDISSKLKGKKIQRLELPGRGNYALRVRTTSGTGQIGRASCRGRD